MYYPLTEFCEVLRNHYLEIYEALVMQDNDLIMSWINTSATEIINIKPTTNKKQHIELLSIVTS